MTKTVKRTPTKSPRMPKRSTEEKGWYKSFCDEMGTPRGRQPYIFDSNVSDVRYRSTSELNQPYHSDYDSNYWGRRSSSLKRNFSPKSEKSVEFGPITEMVEKQEFYSHRDARHGKVCCLIFFKFYFIFININKTVSLRHLTFNSFEQFMNNKIVFNILIYFEKN